MKEENYDELKAAYLDFALDVERSLKIHVLDHKPIESFEVRIIYDEENQRQEVAIPLKRYRHFVHDFVEQGIPSIEANDRIAKLFLENGYMKDHVETDQAFRKDTFLRMTIGTILITFEEQDVDSLEIDLKQVENEFDELFYSYAAREIEHRTLIPIQSTYKETVNHRFPNGVTIRNYGSQECSCDWNQSFALIAPCDPIRFAPELCLEIIETLPNNQSPTDKKNIFNDVRDALRVCKLGKIACGITFESRRVHHSLNWAKSRTSFANEIQRETVEPLTKSDLKLLDEVLTSIDTNRAKLHIPVDRFSRSVERKTPEDRIIDLAIMLESTLLSELNNELGFRIRVRGTEVAQETDLRGERWVTHVLKLIYSLRSSIVHEGKSVDSISKDLGKSDVLKAAGIETVHQFLDASSELCRQILLFYIRNSDRKFKDLNTELDNQTIARMFKEKSE